MTSTLPAPAVLATGWSVPGWAAAAPAKESQPRGAALTEARRATGLTVTSLARRLHVSRPTVSMWERGARAAPRSYWPALGRVLGLDPAQVAELFTGFPPGRHDGRRLPSLALARRRAGLTQRELAGRLGVAPSTVSMWESGGVPVPSRLLAELAQLVATDLEQLVAVPPPPRTGPNPRPLRHFRQAAGMSQREAAAHLRIAVGTLARYEAGERATPVAVGRRIAAIYRRGVGEVLRSSGTPVVPLPPVPWTPDDLPEALTALRLAAGLSKVGLGRLVGRSGQAVSQWEAGRSRPTQATCRRMEAAFGLPAGRLPG